MPKDATTYNSLKNALREGKISKPVADNPGRKEEPPELEELTFKDTYFIDEFIIISEEGTEQYKKFLKNERVNLLRRIHPSKEILEDDAAKKKFPRMSKENLLA